MQWAIEKFTSQFKDVGYSAVYVTEKEAYLDALKNLTKNTLLVYVVAGGARIIFLSDTETDYVTFTIKDGQLQRRQDV